MNARGVETYSNVDQRRQFAALYRSFLFRVIDLQLLSVGGDIRNLLVQLASLLAAYSFVLTLVGLDFFAHHSFAQSQLTVKAWGMEEFLISTTLTVAGLFTVLAWNSLLPDRRDSLVLDPLPVSQGLIFAAKGGAVATALGISIIAVNVFTGVSFPFFVAAAGSGIPALRCLLAYWTTMAAAGVFILLTIFSLQTAAALLGYSFFQRISGLLQLVALFVILSLSFLTPPLATVSGLSAPGNKDLLAFLPSLWFLGLFHVLNGTAHPALRPLASRAVWSLASVCVFALVTGGFTYRRTIRRVIDQPDIAPQRSAAFSRAVSALVSRVFSDSIDRAIFLFDARTLARSREHRLVLAAYIGIALAISFAFSKSLLYGTERREWTHPAAALLIPSVVTLFFALIGTRAVFSLPFALSANWIFRTTAVCKPAKYFAGVRKSLFTLAAIPVLLISAVIYFSIWPGRQAFEHLLVLALLSVLLVQMSLWKFRKIPFACSYLPGYGWRLVEPGVAKITQSCWYDRAGYGWSDPAPRRRAAADIAEDLHNLLKAAGIRPPYLLVGHSVGGFNMRVFAARYEYEVAGLVLVDSADEYEDPRKLPRAMQSAANQYLPMHLRLVVAPFWRFAVHAGAMRLLDDGVEDPDGLMTLEDSRLIHALQLQTKSYDASYFEALSRAETIKQVKAVRDLGTVPMIVLSGAKKPGVSFDNQDDGELLDQFMFHRVHVTQAHLAALSTKGRQVVLDNVGHAIPTEAPVVIVEAVRHILGRN